MHWQKFTTAIADLRQLAAGHTRGSSSPNLPSKLLSPHYRSSCLNYAAEIEALPRFYIPFASTDLLKGKSLDDFKPFLRLPYPAICLLTETYLKNVKPGINLEPGHPAREETHMITIARSMEYCRARARLPHPAAIPVPESTFLISSIVRDPASSNHWVCIPADAFLITEPHSGMRIHPSPFPETHIAQSIDGREFEDDALCIVNLCMLLSIRETRTSPVQVPPKLAKARSASGKLPLYSYHTLTVAGEVWDSPLRGESKPGSPLRSHYRRGHIRHLSEDPPRITYVRHTLVHGKAPGFVHKDYDLKGPTEPCEGQVAQPCDDPPHPHS